MRQIIRAAIWTGFREQVREFGGDPEAILARVHISSAQLDDPERYLPLRAFLEAQELAADVLGRPDFSLRMGSRDNFGARGPLAIAMLNAATGREALEICSRYLHVQSPAARLVLVPTPKPRRELLSLRMITPKGGPWRQNAERMAATANQFLSRIMSAAYRPVGVHLPHKQLAPLSAYREVFGVTPLFSQPQSGLVLDSKSLDALRPGRNAQLRRMAEMFLASISAERDMTFTERVSVIVEELIQAGDCSPAQTAATMALHERTLQRRLKAEGATFEQIKDDIRRREAETLLAQPDVPLSHIALSLGYGDSSAFTRSSRRWFGAAPSVVRARILSSSTPASPANDDHTHPLLVARRLSRHPASR